MNSTISPNLLLPNELERRQMFHLLKKQSSYTAWNRILGYYQKWADITEESVRQADNNELETSLDYSGYVDITKGLALFDEGVRRLAKGDKRVFAVVGLFAKAMGCTRHYFKSKGYIDSGDIGWVETTPLMREFFEALEDLGKTQFECRRDIFEIEDPDRPEYSGRLCYSLWHMVFLPHDLYPTPLPEVPEPLEVVEVKTGESVPYPGIWEPVEGSTCIGTMNYLLVDTRAPKLVQWYRDKNDRRYGYDTITKDATWRLVWRDDRYKDGTIPDEEQDYQFIVPSNYPDYPDSDPWQYLARRNLQNPLLDGVQPEDMRCEGGEACPQDGFWWTPASDPGQGHFKKGDVMPNYPHSKYGATIWYRVKE
jgi:hypothetical protein